MPKSPLKREHALVILALGSVLNTLGIVLLLALHSLRVSLVVMGLGLVLMLISLLLLLQGRGGRPPPLE